MLKKIDSIFTKYSYTTYLVTLVFWMGFLPLFEIVGIQYYLEIAIINILCISAFYFFFKSKSFFQAYFLIPLAIVITNVNLLVDSEIVNQMDKVVILLLFIFVSAHLFKKILNHEEVDLKIMIISITGYIMIGLMSSILCWFTHNLYPGAYSIEFGDYGPIMEFMYYSIVTMTTLGYGDIAPLIPQSKSLAMIITLVGQFYITVIMAVLIGKYLSKKN